MTAAKRIISSMLIAVMAIGMSACAGHKTNQAEGSAEAQTGAWTISDQKTKAVLPDDVAKAFNKATEAFTGSTLEPVAYVGSQVVAGKNYMILCRATTTAQEPETTYQMVIVYADLEGNAELISLKEFDFAKYTEGEGVSKQEMLSGGWYVPEEACGSDLPKDVKEAYEKATAAACWEWAKVDVLAYLGSQTVSGTNYAVLCKGVPTEEETSAYVFVLTFYCDLEGNAEILNSNILDLPEFN